jgi:hypothetical protein
VREIRTPGSDRGVGRRLPIPTGPPTLGPKVGFAGPPYELKDPPYEVKAPSYEVKAPPYGIRTGL